MKLRPGFKWDKLQNKTDYFVLQLKLEARVSSKALIIKSHCDFQYLGQTSSPEVSPWPTTNFGWLLGAFISKLSTLKIIQSSIFFFLLAPELLIIKMTSPEFKNLLSEKLFASEDKDFTFIVGGEEIKVNLILDLGNIE